MMIVHELRRRIEMKRLIVVAAMAMAGCAAQKTETAESPLPPGYVTLATFTGEVDTATGAFTIRSTPTAAGKALQVSMATLPEQGSEGVSIGNSGTPWNNKKTFCGSTANSGGFVVITSNYATSQLRDVWAVVEHIDTTGTYACNPTTSPPPLGLDTTYGVWSYGDLAPAEASSAVPWAFRFVLGANTRFSGRVVGTVMKPFAGLLAGMSGGANMADGNAEKAVLLSATEAVAKLVDASGAVTSTVTLAGSPAGVATTSTVAVILENNGGGDTRIERVRTLDGQVLGNFVTTGKHFYNIAVDPLTGLIWATDLAASSPQAYWYDPANPGTINGSVTLPSPYPAYMKSVDQGGTCNLYVVDVGGDFMQVDCTAKSEGVAIAHLEGCIADTMGGKGLVVAGSDGIGWFIGPDSAGTAKVCRLEGTGLTSPFSISLPAGYSVAYYAMGPDGNIWGQVNDDFNQPAYGLRIWLGATNTGTVTEYAGIVSNLGVASGAGALWFYDQVTGDALRVVP
jgi:hypothetical protein